MLIKDLEVHMFTCKFISNLAQIKGRTSQSIQPSYHESVAFPDIFQAVIEPRTGASCTAFFFLKDFVAVAKLIQLDIEALADGTHPGISDKSHPNFLVFRDA